MFITFDFRCRECFGEEERFVKREDMDKQTCNGCDSPHPMARLPAGTRTHFRFNDRRLKG